MYYSRRQLIGWEFREQLEVGTVRMCAMQKEIGKTYAELKLEPKLGDHENFKDMVESLIKVYAAARDSLNVISAVVVLLDYSGADQKSQASRLLMTSVSDLPGQVVAQLNRVVGKKSTAVHK